MSLPALALLAAAFTACDDSKDNSFVDTYPGADAGGVYVPGEAKTSVDVNVDQTEYSFTLYRGQAKSQITVPVTVTPFDDDVIAEAFSFAPTVTFEAGSLTGQLYFTCDASMLPEEVAQQFIVEIDPAYSTVYGPDAAIFSVSRPGPWESIGIGSYNDYIWSVDGYTTAAQVEFFQSGVNPNMFRITNPYKYETSDPDAFIQFEVVQVGQTVLGQVVDYPDLVYYPDINVEDGFYYTFPGTDPDYTDPAYWDYNYVFRYQDNGLPMAIVLSPIIWYNGDEYPNYMQSEGIEIIFPGVEILDTSATVTYNGTLINPDETINILANVTLGGDVTSAKVAVVQGSTVSNNTALAIANGTIESTTIRSSGDLYLKFDPSNPSGKYSIVAVTFVGDESMSYASATFTYGGGNNWNSLGYVDYTDAFICATFIMEGDNYPLTYSVEIQENANMKGYYRLVNPYGPDSPYGQMQGVTFDTTQDYYLLIDATDPDMVILPESPQGINIGGTGYMTCSMMAYYWLQNGITQNELIEYGYYGYVEDNAIMFFPTTLATYLGDRGPWEANCILLPDASDDPNADYEDIYYGTYIQGQFVPYACFFVDLNDIYSTPQATRTAAKATRSASMPLAQMKYHAPHTAKLLDRNSRKGINKAAASKLKAFKHSVKIKK